MAALALLPVPVIHLVLADLEVQDAFRCSRLCRQFHRAAVLYFYDEFVKYNWSVPRSPTVIVDFWVMRSRQMYALGLEDLRNYHQSALFRFQNVKFIACGYKFEALATHKHELMVVMHLEVRQIVHFSSAILRISAGFATICVLLQDGSLNLLKITAESDQMERFTVDFEGNVGLICVARTNLLFSSLSGDLFSWNEGEIAKLRFNPTPKTAFIQAIESKGAQIFILMGSGALYTTETPSLVVSQVPFFKKKPIALIAPGRMHILALQREDTQPLEVWTAGEVANWLEESRLGDCAERVRKQAISGRELANCSDLDTAERLGIREKERLDRFKVLREKVKNRQIASIFVLYGWGNNQRGQLGKLAPAHIVAPVKMDCPQLTSGEFISSLHCLKAFSVLHTSKGRIFAIGGLNARNRPLDCPPPAWVDLTPGLIAVHPKSSIETVFAGVHDVYYLVVKTLAGKGIGGKMGKKAANEVMKQITWDPDMRPEELIIGYRDGEVGVVELPAEEFQRRLIPSGCIAYFKRYGEVLWQRR